MPKDLAERRQRCLEWMHRPSPVASPHASDEEGDGLDEPVDVAAVLVDLAGGAGADGNPFGGDEDEEMEDVDGHHVGSGDSADEMAGEEC
mmetsp:Transcript_12320/g.36213  ORF Transcript_12320/g.36213 Transcript_12320/m.36213 type:complete len:90 (+) Transcript_12320:544-813(+)